MVVLFGGLSIQGIWSQMEEIAIEQRPVTIREIILPEVPRSKDGCSVHLILATTAADKTDFEWSETVTLSTCTS